MFYCFLRHRGTAYLAICGDRIAGQHCLLRRPTVALSTDQPPNYPLPSRGMLRPSACRFCDTQSALGMRSQSQEIHTDARWVRAAETDDVVRGYQLDSDGSVDANSVCKAWMAWEN